MIRRFAIALALTLMVALAGASAAQARVPGPFMGCDSGVQQRSSHSLKTRPSKCGWWPHQGNMADSGNFRVIHWSSWGTQSATATATSYGAHLGERWSSHVKLRLSRPVTCYGIYRLFTRMTVTFKGETGTMARMRCSDIEDQE
jgi:hypothetical protein